MKIGFITDKIYPFYVGGYETRFWELARRLAGDNDVHVFTSCPKNYVIEGVHFHKIAPYVSYVDEFGYRLFLKDFFYMIQLYKKLLSKMDVIDCNTIPFFHLPFVKLLSKMNGELMVATVHEALFSGLSHYFGKYTEHKGAITRAFFMSNFPFIFLNEVLKLPDEVVAVSRITKSVLTNQFGLSNVTLSSNGVTLPEYPIPSMNERNDSLVYIGRLAPEKRVDDLISAMAVVIKDHPTVNCHIIGAGSDSKKLSRLVKANGLSNSVILHGYVSDSVKNKFLKSSRAFILPSEREGFSIAALEAMSYGLPVIAASPKHYEFSGVFEFLLPENNGLQYPVGDSTELASKISLLLSDINLQKQLSKNAVTTAKKYSWDNIIVSYKKILG
ncbi:MAG: glycosyltransferase family 4 protein [Candidatus Bathyarchaeota archaeon]|nr:glycosyltransferase family 4 protein [Candidatus Bathyarchaeota archaeon]